MVPDVVGPASPEGTGSVVDDPSCAVDGAGTSVGVDTTAPGGAVEPIAAEAAGRARFRRFRGRGAGVASGADPGVGGSPAASAGSGGAGTGAGSSGGAAASGTSVMSKRRSSSGIGRSSGERGPWGGVARENGVTNRTARPDAREEVDGIFNL
jgi:hypothetical protein